MNTRGALRFDLWIPGGRGGWQALEIRGLSQGGGGPECLPVVFPIFAKYGNTIGGKDPASAQI